MWDCLVTIKTMIAFLQKLISQQNLSNKMDQLTLSYMYDQTQNIAVQNECKNKSSSHLAAHKAVKPWKDLMKEMLLNLCAVMFDGM